MGQHCPSSQLSMMSTSTPRCRSEFLQENIRFPQANCKPRMGMCAQEQKCVSHRVYKVYPKAKRKDCRNRDVSELYHPLGKLPRDNPGVWGKGNNPAQIQSKSVPSPRQTCQGPHALLDHLVPNRGIFTT